jgi:hypothetical protein
MRYRKLRIAWSVLWGVVAVLLGVLWVRSRPWQDRLIRHSSFDIEFRSYSGQTILEATPNPNWTSAPYWEVKSRLADHEFYPPPSAHPLLDHAGIQWGSKGGTIYLFLPHWFFVLCALTCCGLPWANRIPFRFSLRTLLIATTLVAVGLGVIVCFAG